MFTINKLHLISTFCIGTCSVISIPSPAALEVRLGGLAVYDTDLDITWVAEAHLAASNSFGLSYGANLGTHPLDSSGVDGIIQVGGLMNWPGALHWIDAMNGANYLGFNDWRMSTALDPDSSCTDDLAGSTPSSDSIGFNCTGGEMGHLFYVEFGAAAGTNVTATGNPAELAKFVDVSDNNYFSGTEYAPNPILAWIFSFSNGSQNANFKNATYDAWAVRDGDVEQELTEILNIDAAINGDPGVGHTPVSINLTAGHYQATLVNPSIESGATFTAWNPWAGNIAGWRTDYIISPVSEQNTGGGSVPNASTAQEAFDLTTDRITNFYLTSNQSVDFYILDATISDNQGGVSLRISPVWGDINNDGDVNTTDVLLATKGVLGTALSDEQLTRGNVAPLVNGIPQPVDPLEALDVADLLLITQKALGVKLY